MTYKSGTVKLFTFFLKYMLPTLEAVLLKSSAVSLKIYIW